MCQLRGSWASSEFAAHCGTDLHDLFGRTRTVEPRHLFHLGFPEVSARYNAIGSFSRITGGRVSPSGSSDPESRVKNVAQTTPNVAQIMPKMRQQKNLTYCFL